MSAGQDAVWGAVVVAAGQGLRFGADKLLAPLRERPVICWSVAALERTGRFREIVVVLNPSAAEVIRETLSQHEAINHLVFCSGGESRSASVRNGLKALSPGVSHVAVHDGARPLVSPGVVSAVLDAAQLCGAAVPAVEASSTIGVRSASGSCLTGKLDRSRLCEIQTPQAAELIALRSAIARFPDETDESSALLRAGRRVSLVPGSPSNIKITVPEDLIVADALLASEAVA